MDKLRALNLFSDDGLNSLSSRVHDVKISGLQDNSNLDRNSEWKAAKIYLESLPCSKCRRIKSNPSTCLCQDEGQYNRQQLDKNPKIFVGNVSFLAKWNELSEFFSQFGKVVHTSIVKNHRTHKPRGIAFVTFQSGASAIKCLTAHPDEVYFQNRHLRVFPAEQKRRDLTNKATLADISLDYLSLDGRHYENCPGFFINDLPDDALLVILSYLNAKERVLIERVCRRWRRLSLESWASLKSLSMQGLITRFGGFSDRNLKHLLLRTKNLQHIDLTGSTFSLTDHSLYLIGDHCPNILELNVCGISATNTSIKVLSEKCSKLQRICLKRCYDVGEKGLWWLFKNCQNLRYINVEDNMRITGQCFHMLGPDIEQVVLNSCAKLTNIGIKKLSEKCKNLSHLSINDCSKLSDDALLAIETMHNLTVICIGGLFREFTTVGLRRLGRLSNLDSLYLTSNTFVDDTVLCHIARGCAKLRILEIVGCHKNVTDIGLGYLSRLQLVEKLNVSYVQKLSDVNLCSIAAHGKLTHLTMRACPDVTLESMAELAKSCHLLQYLDISGNMQLDNLTLQQFVESSQESDRPHFYITIGGTDIETQGMTFHGNITVIEDNLSKTYLRPDRYLSLHLDSDEDDFIEDFDFGMDAGYVQARGEDEGEHGHEFYLDEYDDYLDNDDPLEEERFLFS